MRNKVTIVTNSIAGTEEKWAIKNCPSFEGIFLLPTSNLDLDEEDVRLDFYFSKPKDLVLFTLRWA